MQPSKTHMFPFRNTKFMLFRISRFTCWDFTTGSETVALSSSVTQTDDLRNCEIICGDVYSVIPARNSEIEKADARLIPDLKSAVLCGSRKIVV